MTTRFITDSHYQIKDGLLLETFTERSKTGRVVTPSSGVYYVVPMGTAWVVMACRYADVDEEIDHSAFWTLHVARKVAGYWSSKIPHPFGKLRGILEEHPYAFPRGRVTFVDGLYHVYHGNDLAKALGVKRQTIEAIFGLKGKAHWIEDDHEHCLLADKAEAREVLALEVDWDAV